MDFLRLYTVEEDVQASPTDFSVSVKSQCFSSQNEHVEVLWAQYHEMQIFQTSSAR